MSESRSHRNRIIFVDHSDHGSSIVLDEIGQDEQTTVLDLDALTADIGIRFGPQDKLVLTSENVLGVVMDRLDDPKRAELVNTLKNKHRCREILATMYPAFAHQLVRLDEVADLELAPGTRWVIKPNRGYFATAVKLVDAESDLALVAKEIEAEVLRNAEVFPESVLSDSELIVEEYIDGEEYAVDMFYDSTGEPVIINIYHHPIPENRDYLHVLYYTSKEIFDRLYEPLVAWFRSLNEILDARSFPIHAEFRSRDREFVPVELNPMRFGGDGLVDLAHHAFGFNPFTAYFDDVRPDWEALWHGREQKLYAWVLGYNGSEVNVSSHRPDLRKFGGLFSNILSDSLLDYRRHLGFAVVYVEESDVESIHRLVDTDFREFFLDSDAFTEAAFLQLQRSGVRLRVPGGERVWEADDVGDFVLLVLDGALEVLGTTVGGEEFLVDTIGRKSVVGEYSAMDGLPRSAAVRAGSAGCTAMRISGQAFRRLLRGSPGLFEDLYWQQLSRIRRMNERVSELESQLRLAHP